MKIFTTIFALFTLMFANAQWVSDTDVNTLVVDAEGGDMKAVGTSLGETYVVFWEVIPAPVNYELRLQKLDVDGNKMFGNNGMLVSNAIPMSTFTVLWNITVDADDNLLIGLTGTDNFEAFAFKMDSDGNQLWGANGIDLGEGVPVTILPLSTGEAIVSWQNSGSALMQKYDASGNPVWATAQPIELTASSTRAANMFEISNGDYIVVFHKLLTGINSFLYSQRFDSDGNPQWANPIQIADRATASNRNYTGFQDGDIVYMGYFASAGARFDSYLQRINSDGTIPWGINGSDFDTNETNYETYSDVAFQPGSQYVWSICTYTNTSQSMLGEYVQKFDKDTGARQFTDNAKQLYALSDSDPSIHAGSLQLINDQPLFLVKNGVDTGVSPVTLSTTYLDSNGDFAWAEETRPLATFAGSKSRIQFTKPANTQSVGVFIEDKGIGPKIYAQNFKDETLSVDNVTANNFKLFYNNPITDLLNIESESTLKAIYIYDILGKNIFQKDYTEGIHETKIPTQNWKSGMYFITVQTQKNEVKSAKIVKQ